MADRMLNVIANVGYESQDGTPRAAGDAYAAPEPEAIAGSEAGLCWLVSNPRDFVANPYPAPPVVP